MNVDLNLLRVFDAIYAARSISRAAERLDMSQPACSQALGRLRLLLRDPLFERTAGGVKPTERAHQLARSVQGGLALLEEGLKGPEVFHPSTSRAELKLHLTDIGEMRFLPRLLATLARRAPGVRVTTRPWPQTDIAEALHSQALDLAIGYLPLVEGTLKVELLRDRYVLMVRAGHPMLRGKKQRTGLTPDALGRFEYVTVRSHSDTQRILQVLRLEEQIRLYASSFLALPSIVRSTDLAVVIPRDISREFEPRNEFVLLEPDLPSRDFTVSLHWGRRHEHDPFLRWMRALVVELFQERDRPATSMHS